MGPDYKNFSKDITGEIKNELRALKKNGGKLKFTTDQTYSSSSLLNQFGYTFNFAQKTYIENIKSKKLSQIIQLQLIFLMCYMLMDRK